MTAIDYDVGFYIPKIGAPPDEVLLFLTQTQIFRSLDLALTDWTLQDPAFGEQAKTFVDAVDAFRDSIAEGEISRGIFSSSEQAQFIELREMFYTLVRKWIRMTRRFPKTFEFAPPLGQEKKCGGIPFSAAVSAAVGAVGVAWLMLR